MKKSDVNGDNTNEVYKWLKNEKSGLLGLSRIKARFKKITSIIKTLVLTSSQWNFEKFLVDKNGNVVQRWASVTTPDSIDAEVAKII